MFKNIDLKKALTFCLLTLAVVFNSCDDEKKDDAGAKVVLNSFGPSVLRGGELKFIGNNLNKVTAIVLPGNVEVPASSFKTHDAELITIDVPDEAVEGVVTLKTPDGDIVTKTSLSILEPITITKIPAESVRPGSVITIEGTYLNLIREVIFATNKSVTQFESQTRTSLSVRVPDDAESGMLTLLDSEEIPNEIETEAELLVTLPAISSITPETVKAGNTITIEGTDLDLVTVILFGGDQKVDSADFASITPSQIVVAVPLDTDDGEISVVPASQVTVKSSSALIMSLPQITEITPNPAKTGGEITVTGTDLDLVSEVIFEGDKAGKIKNGGTATSLTIEVPVDAKSGAIEFRTKANKAVTSQPLPMLKPAITTMTSEVKLNETITITGTNLDIVKEVKLTGGTKGEIDAASTATELVVKVPLGTTTGTVTLVADNGDEVVSTSNLTILAEVPEFESFPAWAKPGAKLVLEGEKLNLTNEVIFPGDVKATRFGDRTATKLEVYVPENVTLGKGKITFTTYGTDVTESSEIRFTWADPVKDPALIINSFDENGHDLGWDNWAGNVELGSDPTIALTGKYLHGKNENLSGWSWIWGCNHSQLPKPSVTTADHYLKIDVKITKAIPADVNFQLELAGVRIDLGNLGQTTPGSDWTTITFDLSKFPALPATLPTDQGAEWGMNLSAGTVDLTGLYMDNFRFEAK